MRYEWWNYVFVVAASVLRLALAATLIKQPRRWGMLLAFVLFDAANDAIGILTRSHYAIYFYTYWVAAGIHSLLSVGVLANAILRIPNVRTIQKSHAFVFLTVAFAIAALAFAYQLGLHPKSSLAPPRCS